MQNRSNKFTSRYIITDFVSKADLLLSWVAKMICHSILLYDLLVWRQQGKAEFRNSTK